MYNSRLYKRNKLTLRADMNYFSGTVVVVIERIIPGVCFDEFRHQHRGF